MIALVIEIQHRLTLSKIITFYVVFTTLLRLVQKAWKVAHVGNFVAVRGWGPDGKVQTAGAREISESGSQI